MELRKLGSFFEVVSGKKWSCDPSHKVAHEIQIKGQMDNLGLPVKWPNVKRNIGVRQHAYTPLHYSRVSDTAGLNGKMC